MYVCVCVYAHHRRCLYENCDNRRVYGPSGGGGVGGKDFLSKPRALFCFRHKGLYICVCALCLMSFASPMATGVHAQNMAEEPFTCQNVWRARIYGARDL